MMPDLKMSYKSQYFSYHPNENVIEFLRPSEELYKNFLNYPVDSMEIPFICDKIQEYIASESYENCTVTEFYVFISEYSGPDYVKCDMNWFIVLHDSEYNYDIILNAYMDAYYKPKHIGINSYSDVVKISHSDRSILTRMIDSFKS